MKVEEGPTILECDGEKIVSAFSKSTKTDRETFRVDGKGGTFEVWNPSDSTFFKWGDGTLRVDRDTISYIAVLTSEGIAANRKISIDRHNGSVVDDIAVSLGSTHFAGQCRTVDRASALEQQF